MKTAVLLSVLIFSSMAAHADFMTAGKLLSYCQPSGQVDTAQADADCQTYLMGVIDTFSLVRNLDQQKPLFCFPQKITSTDIKHSVVKWLESNPDILNFSAAQITMMSLHDAYPCEHRHVQRAAAGKQQRQHGLPVQPSSYSH